MNSDWMVVLVGFLVAYLALRFVVISLLLGCWRGGQQPPSSVETVGSVGSVDAV